MVTNLKTLKTKIIMKTRNIVIIATIIFVGLLVFAAKSAYDKYSAEIYSHAKP